MKCYKSEILYKIVDSFVTEQVLFKVVLFFNHDTHDFF